MGKRSSFERNPRDFYRTPRAAVIPLLPYLGPLSCRFVEPCAGDGALITHLSEAGHKCVFASDIHPLAPGIAELDALTLDRAMIKFAFDFIITNPAWARHLLNPMIDHFLTIAPTWLLFDADWAHTETAAELMGFCSRIVSVGRVQWIEGSGTAGVDNAAWYLFEPGGVSRRTIFEGASFGPRTYRRQN